MFFSLLKSLNCINFSNPFEIFVNSRDLQSKLIIIACTSADGIFIHEPFKHFILIFVNFINSHEYNLYEWNIINEESKTAFINKIKKESEKEKQREDAKEEEEQEDNKEKTNNIENMIEQNLKTTIDWIWWL